MYICLEIWLGGFHKGNKDMFEHRTQYSHSSAQTFAFIHLQMNSYVTKTYLRF